MTPKPRHRLRPALDCLEAREVPAAVTGVVPAVLPTPAPVAEVARVETSVGAKVAAFAAAKLGQRVGGGECAQFAAEALRAAGARFTVFGTGTTDYAWGDLITRVRGTPAGGVFSNPTAAVRPGDLLQYSGALFRDGTTGEHNTAVVAAADAAGRVTAVYQQNFAGVRVVTRQPLDLRGLMAGSVTVYRPAARVATAGVFRFSVVNNTTAPVWVTERAGTGVATYALSKADTTASYQARWWTTYGGVRPVLTVAGRSVVIEDGAGYEIYRTAAGAVALRKLAA